MVYGYSRLAFGEGNHFGNADGAMLKNIALTAVTGTIYQYIHVAFQDLSPVLPSADCRRAGGAYSFFGGTDFVGDGSRLHIPIAHMVWGGGLLAAHGALDFAGGTVVYWLTPAIAGLVGAYLIGQTRALFWEKEAFKTP